MFTPLFTPRESPVKGPVKRPVKRPVKSPVKRPVKPYISFLKLIALLCVRLCGTKTYMYDKAHIAQVMPHVKRLTQTLTQTCTQTLTQGEGVLWSRDVQGELVRALGELVRSRDTYTASHNERVGELSRCIAERLGCSPAEIEHIARCGALHDVGKLGLPLSAIHKPSALTEAEYELVKRHPEMGLELLKRVPALLEFAPGVLYHHERFDGAGYPFGLKGSEIPLSARVVAVADTIDAMMSDRSYRPALTWAHVYEELLRCRAHQLDPRVVEAALPLCC